MWSHKKKESYISYITPVEYSTLSTFPMHHCRISCCWFFHQSIEFSVLVV